ncbi:hypothetical protein BKI51_10320 [Alphaproteobacteria bacterium AO1-B]|nr:hypothetical protein BKI51_10320 [Alphaproteobacteria bacterium AO1-B]
MTGYITLGTNELEKAAVFYDTLLEKFGAARTYSLERMIAWGSDPAKPMLVVTKPSDGNTARPGNGNMIALICKDTDHVRAVHKLAVRPGAENVSPPAEYGGQFFGDYFRDLDGNKICVFVMSQDTTAPVSED